MRAESHGFYQLPTLGDIVIAALDNPHLAYQAAQYREPPTLRELVTYDLLRRLAAKPPVSAIIETRLAQVSAFMRREPNPRLPGFEIRPRVPEEKITEAHQREADRIASFLETCGNWDWADKYPQQRVFRARLELDYWVKAILRDSLRYDQACTQIIYNRMGKPLCFLPIDASSIRIKRDGSGYMQVLDSIPIAEFDAHEIGFGVRRPRTDLSSLGYGFPELVELVEVLTAFLWGFQYNYNYFRQGFNSKGLLILSGPMNPEQFQTFRRDVQAMATGVGGAHRLPILNFATEKGSASWLRLQNDQRDMEYKDWMNWLLKVTCALFLIDPAEIGFQFGTEGQRSAIYQANPETRVEMGKDKGLRPLLWKVQQWINRWIVWPLNEEFALRFKGIGDFAEKDKADYDKTRAQTYMTIDEVRAENNLPPLPGGVGKLPANPSLLQIIQLAAMNQVVSMAELLGKEGEQEGGGGFGGWGGFEFGQPGQGGGGEEAPLEQRYETAKLEGQWEAAKEGKAMRAPVVYPFRQKEGENA